MVGSAFIGRVKDIGEERKFVYILESHLAQEVYSLLRS